MPDGLPPRFKPWRAPTAKPVRRDGGQHRGSPRDRGYDAHWDRLSKRFRRANPFCLFCQQECRTEDWQPTAVADHALPAVEFPELRYSWSNLVPLCGHHHDVTKQRLEAYAREHGQLKLLPKWCREPLSRPTHLRPLKLGGEPV